MQCEDERGFLYFFIFWGTIGGFIDNLVDNLFSGFEANYNNLAMKVKVIAYVLFKDTKKRRIFHNSSTSLLTEQGGNLVEKGLLWKRF